jgi:hypothetical protein
MTVIVVLQPTITAPALRGSVFRSEFSGGAYRNKMPRTNWPVLLCLCALALGCDAIPISFKLGGEIQREFKVTHALVLVADSVRLVVVINDDSGSSLEPKALAAFQERVAAFAVTHHQRGRLSSIGVLVVPATRQVSKEEMPLPLFFVPEYHPDGSVRMAALPRGQRSP